MTVKTCPRCVRHLDESNFSLNKKTGRSGSWCKTCRKQATAKYRADNPSYGKRYYEANRERMLKYSREHPNPDAYVRKVLSDPRLPPEDRLRPNDEWSSLPDIS